MGFLSAIGGLFGRTNNTNVKKEETEFEKNKLKNINLDEGEKKLNWQDLRSKQNIKEDLAEEKVEDKWNKLDKMLEDIEDENT